MPKRRIGHYILEGSAVVALAVLTATVVMLHLTRPPLAQKREATSLEDETVSARVVAVEQSHVTTDETGLIIAEQTLTLEIRSGPHAGERVTVDYYGMGPTEEAVLFREGQQALVMVSRRPDGEVVFQVADHIRLTPLAALTLLLIAVTIWVGRGQGFRALAGMGLSLLLIGGFIIPQILAYRDAVLVALSGTALLMLVTLYLIQGWNVIGHAAALGLLGSLLLTGGLSVLWARLAHLTGFGSEETLYLQSIGVGVEMRGLLLAGIILGTAGVLDDVVLAQAVTVFELAEADPALPRYELYRRGMRVGVAHLSSMVNTLVLAYASAALPLLLLFYLYPEPWYLTVNRELIAEEIIRTLMGSLGLMMAVPLTTAIAAWAAGPSKSHKKPPLDAAA